MSISYGIIRRQGGNIEVESKEGKGTTFSVYLLENAVVSGDGSLDGILQGLAEVERTNRRATAELLDIGSKSRHLNTSINQDQNSKPSDHNGSNHSLAGDEQDRSPHRFEKIQKAAVTTDENKHF